MARELLREISETFNKVDKLQNDDDEEEKTAHAIEKQQVHDTLTKFQVELLVFICSIAMKSP